MDHQGERWHAALRPPHTGGVGKIPFPPELTNSNINQILSADSRDASYRFASQAQMSLHVVSDIFCFLFFEEG